MGTPSVTAVKFLFANSRNVCFFNIVDGDDRYTCEVELTRRGFDRCLGQIAHISSDQPGGPRYDAGMTATERQSEANLMLLCPNCHRRVDDLEPGRFTVDDLQTMKERHLSRSSDGWKPTPHFVSQVAEDMVDYLLSRLTGAGPSSADADDDDAPTGVMGSSGIGFMSDTVGANEARQMWADAWRRGSTEVQRANARRENRRKRLLPQVLDRHGLSAGIVLSFGGDEGGTLTVTGSKVPPAALEELRQAGHFDAVETSD